MPSVSKSGPLIIFYILVAYIVIQLGWWGYHIIEQNEEITMLRLAHGSTPERNKIWMVIGEGSVFFILLALGVLKIRSSFKKEAKLAARQKNFLLSVTHELKSPIASVKLYLETLLKREVEKEKEREILFNAISESERLAALVDNILLAAKIESDTYLLSKTTVNLSEYTEEIISKSMPALRGSHKIKTEIEPNMECDIDLLAFSSILLNLLENAGKYSPKQSTITIKLEKNNRAIALTVMDEGIGIPEEEKSTIFQKFYRIGSEETRSTKGTGLGLYIVKVLAEKLNGTITVKNNSPKGSLFELRF
ncbi:MAG: two-component sensor histidine kinase [Flavobacteriales bacterium]|nr:GHKL domain-containing protein [Bacteroidales bacterium AH-315-I05]PCJ79915.1 MAG: two-component sensor histidine kinase [Flavobacteriales bacterium]